MDDAEDTRHTASQKRARAQLQDDNYGCDGPGSKRLEIIHDDIPQRLQLTPPDIGFASPPRIEGRQVVQENTTVDSLCLAPQLEMGGNSSSESSEEGCGAPPDVEHSMSESCLGSYQECCTNYSCSGANGFDELFFRDASDELRSRGTSSQAAESCCGEDTQLDINSFLENWDEGVDCLASDDADLIEGGNVKIPSVLGGGVDTISVPGVDADWPLGDLQYDGKVCWNGASEQEQEWITMAVASLDTATDALDMEASMLHMLEADTGI